MKFIFMMDGVKIISAASGGDESKFEIPVGLKAYSVSRSDFEKYKKVMSSNSTKFLSWNDSLKEFILNDIPENQATIDKFSIIADGIDTIIINNLSNPSTIMIENIGIYTIMDGLFEFTIDTPGTYKLMITSKNFLKKEFLINAS